MLKKKDLIGNTREELIVKALEVQVLINDDVKNHLEDLRDELNVLQDTLGELHDYAAEIDDDVDNYVDMEMGLSGDNDAEFRKLNNRVIGLQIGFGITLLTLIGLSVYSLL